jgi:hypothetical protein
MRVAIASIACVAAFTLTGCFEGPKGDKGDKGETGTAGLPDQQAFRDIQERTFRSSSIQRMAPARILTKLL